MAVLLNKDQQQLIKPIAPNWAGQVQSVSGKDNYTQLAEEVELKELRTLLGVALLQDIQKNPATQENIELLDGGSFDCGDIEIDFQGLRFVLAFMNYSKYVGMSFVSNTFTGMVKKNRQEAENLSTGEVKRLQLDARELALQEFALIKQFLDQNTTAYPLWRATPTKKTYAPKMTGVRRTLN